MALYKISTKTSFNSAGYHIDPGMSVEISSLAPIISVAGPIAETVNTVFMAKYGVDLKKMNCLNPGFLKVEKL